MRVFNKRTGIHPGEYIKLNIKHGNSYKFTPKHTVKNTLQIATIPIITLQYFKPFKLCS